MGLDISSLACMAGLAMITRKYSLQLFSVTSCINKTGNKAVTKLLIQYLFSREELYYKSDFEFTIWCEIILGYEMPIIMVVWNLLTFTLTFTERHGLKETRSMENVQMKIIDALRDHCTYNSEAQKKAQFFSRILGKIPELRTLCREGIQRFYSLEKVAPPPAIIQNLFLSNQLPF